MDWLQHLLDSSGTPVLTAFILGVLTSISPCPLATNIAAVGYIGKDVDHKRNVLRNGLYYTLGRMVSYAVLGVILILIIRQGASTFGIQDALGRYGMYLLGPLLILIGLFMLLAKHLNLPQITLNGSRWGKTRGRWGAFMLGILFAMAFCPTSGVFYFGMLIPMSAYAQAGYLLPVVYAIATSLPVIFISWVLAFCMGRLGRVYNSILTLQKWANISVAVLFILTGFYECYMVYI